MLVTCWSVKGGAGVSVVSAALGGLLAQRHGSAAIIDLGGDQPAVMGLAEPTGPGVLDWCNSSAPVERLASLCREVTGDLLLVPRGSGRDHVDADRAAELVRGCAALAPVVVVDAGVPLDMGHTRRSATETVPLAARLRDNGTSVFVTRPCYVALRRAKAAEVTADGVVLVDEPGRALQARDVSEVLGIPVVGVVEVDPQVSRAVDAGTLMRRPPQGLRRGLRRAI